MLDFCSAIWVLVGILLQSLEDEGFEGSVQGVPLLTPVAVLTGKATVGVLAARITASGGVVHKISCDEAGEKEDCHEFHDSENSQVFGSDIELDFFLSLEPTLVGQKSMLHYKHACVFVISDS